MKGRFQSALELPRAGWAVAMMLTAAIALGACGRREESSSPRKQAIQSSADARNSRQAFAPSRNGFAFANNFPGTPLPTFLGGSSSRSSAFGLCGGMTAAAADFYLSGELPPRSRDLPKRGSTLYEYLYLRQAESIGPGLVTATKFAEWTAKSDAALAELTLTELAALEAALKLQPVVPIGLILARPAGAPGARDVWDNHQVLALAVTRTAGPSSILAIWVYDPNFPVNDKVRIELNFESTPIGRRKRDDGHAGTEVRGVFVLPYELKTPPKIELP